MSCTVDASVFVAAARRQEAHHSESRAFLRRAESLTLPIICRTLVLPECAAAVARSTEEVGPAAAVITRLERLPRLHLVPLDQSLASAAAEIAMAQRLRGADSVYVAVAQAFRATLVTWDQEMLDRAAPAAEAMTPTQWMEQQGGGA